MLTKIDFLGTLSTDVWIFRYEKVGPIQIKCSFERICLWHGWKNGKRYARNKEKGNVAASAIKDMHGSSSGAETSRRMIRGSKRKISVVR